MTYADTIRSLLPPVSYNRSTAGIRQAAAVNGQCLDNIQASAARMLGAIDPRTSGHYLNRWEEVLGLNSTGKNGQQRIQAVMIKLNETGGLSIPYFIQLASSIGYQITITEPQPFRAGVNRAGDRLGKEDIMWVWWVNVSNADNRALVFRAGISAAGDRLSDFCDPIIESVIHDLKPAFSAVRFTYKVQGKLNVSN